MAMTAASVPSVTTSTADTHTPAMMSRTALLVGAVGRTVDE